MGAAEEIKEERESQLDADEGDGNKWNNNIVQIEMRLLLFPRWSGEEEEEEGIYNTRLIRQIQQRNEAQKRGFLK